MSQKEVEKAEAQGLLDYFKIKTKVTTSNMMCFDFEGRIKKYDSPEAILEEWYPQRLAFYQKRKVCLFLVLYNVYRITWLASYRLLSNDSRTRLGLSR